MVTDKRYKGEPIFYLFSILINICKFSVMKIKLGEGKELPKMSFECSASIIDKDTFENGLSLFANISDISKNFKSETPVNESMWYLAGNLAVPGLANKNGHGISIEDAVRIKGKFIGQQINKDHDRTQVVGYISKAILTDRDSGLEISDEDAIAGKKPVNLTIGFIVWPHVDESMATTIEAVTNPLVVEQGYISLSWEMSFDEYFILTGSQNIYEGNLITDEASIETYKPYLPWNDGKCITAKGERFYVIAGGENLTPLGAGLVVNPAAQVKGIVMIAEEEKEIEKIDVLAAIDAKYAGAIAELKAGLIELQSKQNTESLIKSSQSNSLPVTSLKQSTMKIKSIDQITDENLGVEIKASAISEFFTEELAKKSEEYSNEVKAKAVEATTAKESLAALTLELEALKTKNTEVEAKLKEIEDARDAEQIVATFNERMNLLDGEFELSDEDREIIAGQIRGLADEDFTGWTKSFNVLAKEKNKEVIASKKPVVTVVASEEKKEDEVKPDETKPLEDLTPATTVVASTLQFGDDSINKYRDAFTIGKGITVTI